MKLKSLSTVGAVLLALFSINLSANASRNRRDGHYRPRTEKVSSGYFIHAPTAIGPGARSVSGTASRGVQVLLKNYANGRVVAQTHASRRNGHYTLRLPKRYSVGSRLYVVGRHGLDHPYRIVWVKETPVSRKVGSLNRMKREASRFAKRTNALGRRSRTKNDSRRVKNLNRRVNKHTPRRRTRLNQLTGDWWTKRTDGSVQNWNFSQKSGLNETLYRGRSGRQLVKNAPYHVRVNGNRWHVSGAKAGSVNVQVLNNHQFRANHMLFDLRK